MSIRLMMLGLWCLFMSQQVWPATEALTVETPIITIKVSRFAYSPSQIKLKKGQMVILELESADREHGFAIPDLNVRVDVLPGQKVTLKITPEKTGTIVFFCDIFCGSGHETMSGELIVEE